MRVLTVFLHLALLAGCATGDSISDRRAGQLLVCHDEQSIAVSNADLYVHESHGDSLGPCPGGG